MIYSAPEFLRNPRDSKSVWVGDLGTRPKNLSFDVLGLKIYYLLKWIYKKPKTPFLTQLKKCFLAYKPTLLNKYSPINI